MLRNMISVIKAQAGCLLWLTEKSINHLQPGARDSWVLNLCTARLYYFFFIWLQGCRWRHASYSHIKYEMTSHLYGRNGGSVSAPNAIAYLWKALCFIFPFPMLGKVLQELLIPWQITLHPHKRVLRRQKHGHVRRNRSECVARFSSQLCQVWHLKSFRLGVKEQWEKIWKKLWPVRLSGWNNKASKTMAPSLWAAFPEPFWWKVLTAKERKKKKTLVDMFLNDVLSFFSPSAVIEWADFQSKQFLCSECWVAELCLLVMGGGDCRLIS